MKNSDVKVGAFYHLNVRGRVDVAKILSGTPDLSKPGSLKLSGPWTIKVLSTGSKTILPSARRLSKLTK